MDCAHAPRVDGQPLDEIQTGVMAVGQYEVGLSNRPVDLTVVVTTASRLT
jgi:hypothetical protein